MVKKAVNPETKEKKKDSWERKLASILMSATDVPTRKDVVDTGSLSLNLNLQWGGLPVGNLIRIWGEPHAGKTTIAQRSVANQIHLGKKCAWIDSETDIHPARMQANGIDTDKLMVWRYSKKSEIPMTYENMFSVIYTWIDQGYETIVVDSIDAIPTKAMMEGEPGDKHYGGRASINSIELPRLKGICAAEGVTIIFVQQIRDGIGDLSFGDVRKPSGGWAMSHSCPVEIKIVVGRNITSGSGDDKESIGHYARYTIINNKNTVATIKGEFPIRSDYGIDLPSEIIEYGIMLGLIKKTVGWHNFIGYTLADGKPANINGEEAARQWLISEPAIMLQLYDKILELAK